MIQLQFINKLLDSQDSSLIILNNLNEDFFSDYKAEFKFIKEHIDAYGNVPDKVTFINKFPNFDIIEVRESDNYLIDALYKDKYKRNLALTLNNVREALINDDTEKALEIFSKSADLVTEAKHLSAIDITKDISRYDKYVDKISNFNNYYVTTGFPEIDDIIGGWDRKEELATIVARTNSGKSFLVLKTAIAAAQRGLNVGIYSGEMSETKVGYRLDTLVSHISNTKITHGEASIKQTYKEFLDSIKDKIPGAVYVLTPAMINGAATVSALRAFIEKYNLDMLCVDQHSLLEDEHHARSPVEKASNISFDLKKLQTLKQIPIIAVSQQNREKNENGPDTTNISQSDRIGQDSTIVIFFEKKDNLLTIYITKSRDSVNGKTLKYAVDFDKGIFQYIPTENDGKQGEGCAELREEYEAPNGEEVF